MEVFMDKEWLTEELDNTPYECKNEEVFAKAKQIDEIIAKINNYFEEHPALKEQIYSEENFKKRIRRSALSFLSLETNETLDIVPSANQTMVQKLTEEDQVKSLKAFEDAHQLAHMFAQKPNCYLDERMFVELHRALSRGKESFRGRLRNESDSPIIYGKGDKVGLGGYFAPVEGEDVQSRVGILLYNFENEWQNDNYFVRCAKFVAEYVRIQPHVEGNKRVALMILNYLLEKENYSAIYFTKDQLDDFYLQLKNAILHRDVSGLTLIIENTLMNRYNAIAEEIRDYRLQKLDGTQI